MTRLRLSDSCGERCVHPAILINVDRNPSYPKSIAELKQTGDLGRRCRCRPVRYLNNIVEQDHRAIKLRLRACQDSDILSRRMANASGNRNDEHDTQGTGEVNSVRRHCRPSHVRPRHSRPDPSVTTTATDDSPRCRFYRCNTTIPNFLSRESGAPSTGLLLRKICEGKLSSFDRCECLRGPRRVFMRGSSEIKSRLRITL